jgi:hypothetical protein
MCVCCMLAFVPQRVAIDTYYSTLLPLYVCGPILLVCMVTLYLSLGCLAPFVT